MPVVRVADIERSRAFYEDVLGFTFLDREDSSAFFTIGEQMFVINDDDGMVAMVNPDVPDDPARAKIRSIHSLRVDDVDAAYEELRAKGVTFLQPPQDRPWEVRIAFFEDPDGHIWEIAQDHLNAPKD